jgi:ribonuclease HII
LKFPDYKTEQGLLAEGFDFVIGCDEVGMGCVAGPVVSCACVLNPETISPRGESTTWWNRVRDSKTVSQKERETLYQVVEQNSIGYAFGQVDAEMVDRLNIFQSAMLARKTAIISLLEQLRLAGNGSLKRVGLLIDGKFVIPDLNVEHFDLKQFAIIKGDTSILTISAASILAKVRRDSMMGELDREFPGYDFSKHKGYNTPAHQRAIQDLGLTPEHRKTFLKKYL